MLRKNFMKRAVKRVAGNPHPERTAIKRGDLSAPARWLDENGLIEGKALDFGCGHGEDADYLGMNKYDPFHHDDQKALKKKYDTITCTYVLNTLPKKEADQVVKEVKKLLKPGGKAFFTVRRDVKGVVRSARDTTQRNARLKAPSVYKDANFEIYQVSK